MQFYTRIHSRELWTQWTSSFSLQSEECALEELLPTTISGFTATSTDGHRYFVHSIIACYNADNPKADDTLFLTRGYRTNMPCYRCQAREGNFAQAKRWDRRSLALSVDFVIVGVRILREEIDSSQLNFLNQTCDCQYPLNVNPIVCGYLQ